MMHYFAILIFDEPAKAEATVGGIETTKKVIDKKGPTGSVHKYVSVRSCKCVCLRWRERAYD